MFINGLLMDLCEGEEVFEGIAFDEAVDDEEDEGENPPAIE
jgi:hypothetical protein